MRLLLISCLGTSLAVCSIPVRAQGQKQKGPSQTASEGGDGNKTELRNNSASLLADLLGQEKEVSKILIIKHNSAELGRLMKAISQTAGDGVKRLEELARQDSSLDLHALQLPPGEKATRAAITKTEEHDLLLTSGLEFELNLLLTQTQALSYGSHLAKVAAENSPTRAETREFHSLDVALQELFHQVVLQIRALPRK